MDLLATTQVELEAAIAFTGRVIESLAEKRAEDAIEVALADPRVRLMVMEEGRLCLRFGEGSPNPYFSPVEAARLNVEMKEMVLLGLSPGGPVLAAPLSVSGELPPELKSLDFRSIYSQQLLPPEDLGALAQGAALISWHRNHRFCGRCGSETESRAGGMRRSCPACSRDHFPRTDPVAIMLAVRGDMCLLGRSPHFQPGMYSCLAGFIEPGENIEGAVRREILEESGIRIGRVVYCASQPWPFPYSLMIGCLAEATSDEIKPDTEELEDCRWFSREEARRLLAGTHEAGLKAPNKGAIANHLMSRWAKGG